MGIFVDCHCHAFNFIDIPVYLTLTDKVKMGTVTKLKAATVALLYAPKVIASKNSLARKLAEHKEFIHFFESSVERGLEALLHDIRAYVVEDEGRPDNTEVLITPLVMDFDVLLREEKSGQAGKEPSVKEQYCRLERAINTSIVQDIPNSHICPFVGFDLRKLRDADDDKLAGFKTFWEASNTLGAGSIQDLESGKLLGIKLYPPIGFNPCPETLPPTYRAFYQWCCDNDIPLTAHCQTGSFAAGKEKHNIDRNTTPENWRRLLRHPELKSLRINFAHFGGETGTDDMFDLLHTDEDSWTFILIGLLKKYPNTFADIAAYDYSKSKHRKDLVRIFEEDAAGEYGPGFRLADKLLWGSDVPMVISDKSYRSNHKPSGSSEYKYYIRSFIDTIKSSKVLTVAQQEEIVRNLTEVNPKTFLRIQ